MGLLSWWRGGNKEPESKTTTPPTAGGSTKAGTEVAGLHGAVEVQRRPADVTVFEFGSAADSGDRITVAGYCPVSEDLEPCRWEIIPAPGNDAPLFRVVF